MSECKHIFGEQYDTASHGIFGMKCKKCGFVLFTKGAKIADCGCHFEDQFNNSVSLCEQCSNLPCHNRGE